MSVEVVYDRPNLCRVCYKRQVDEEHHKRAQSCYTRLWEKEAKREYDPEDTDNKVWVCRTCHDVFNSIMGQALLWSQAPHHLQPQRENAEKLLEKDPAFIVMLPHWIRAMQTVVRMDLMGGRRVRKKKGKR